MKSKFWILVNIIFMFFGFTKVVNASYGVRIGSGKGKKLATLYTSSGTDAFKNVGKSQKWLYKSSEHSEMKIKILENGVELKLESVDICEVGDTVKVVATGTLFDTKTAKNGIYSFSSGLPEGVPYHRLTVRYKGKEVKYDLHWGLSIVLDDEGEPADELTELDLYSGDIGDYYETD